MPHRSAAALVALALALAGCGTTVPGATSLSAGSPADGLGAPGAAVADGTTPLPAGATAASPGRTGSSSGAPRGGATSTTGASAPVSPGSRPGGTVGTAPGATGPVRVGLLFLDGAEAAAGALGLDGLTTGDTRAQARAIVEHLNGGGGLRGRRIDLREGRLDAAAMSSDAEGQHAQACAKLTQDDDVAYVVSYVQLSSAQLACYAKRGVVVLDDQSSVLDSSGAQYASTFAGPGELALGRAAEELVEALWRRGWLTPASTVGTFVYDTPDGVALETRHLVPALQRRGLTPTTARSPVTADGANQSGTVVRFRSAGVDRVIPLGANPLFLMNAAESQGYRPRYAVTSTFGPGSFLEGSAPREQLRGGAGIGWSKFLDIGAGTRPGAVSANETRCFDVMRRARQAATSATVQAFQVALCNVLFFLDAAAERYGVTPSLLDDVRARGLEFPPADAFAVRMRPGRADGVAAYRDLAFSDECDCFQYVSGDVATR